MDLGPQNARNIVHRSFNQGRPIGVGRGCLRQSVEDVSLPSRSPPSREERIESAKPSTAAIMIGPVPRLLTVEPRRKPRAPATRASGNGMALDKMLGTKVASRALDLRIDLGQSVAKVLTRLVSFILVFGNLFFRCHVFNCEGLRCPVSRCHECRSPFR